MTRRIINLLVSVVTAATAYVVTLSAQPPKSLTEEGACPFECCSYREWSVLADTPLFEKPKNGSRIASEVLRGSKVQGLTGTVVVTNPEKIEVLKPHTGESGKTYKPGETVWVYTELGEGLFKVWHNGEMYNEEAFFMYPDADPCIDDGACWGNEISFPKSLWLVKIKTKAEIIRWSSPHPRISEKKTYVVRVDLTIHSSRPATPAAVFNR